MSKQKCNKFTWRILWFVDILKQFNFIHWISPLDLRGLLTNLDLIEADRFSSSGLTFYFRRQELITSKNSKISSSPVGQSWRKCRRVQPCPWVHDGVLGGKGRGRGGRKEGRHVSLGGQHLVFTKRICHNINVRIAWEQIPHHHPLHRQGWKSCRHRRRKQSQGEGRLWPEEMSNDKRQKKITNDKRPMKIIYDKRPPQWQMTKGSPCVVSIYGHCHIETTQGLPFIICYICSLLSYVICH